VPRFTAKGTTRVFVWLRDPNATVEEQDEILTDCDDLLTAAFGGDAEVKENALNKRKYLTYTVEWLIRTEKLLEKLLSLRESVFMIRPQNDAKFKRGVDGFLEKQMKRLKEQVRFKIILIKC
jgi:hypothetical protein